MRRACGDVGETLAARKARSAEAAGEVWGGWGSEVGRG